VVGFAGPGRRTLWWVCATIRTAHGRRSPDMSNAFRTTATKPVPMDSARKTAFVAGALYLITFVASIPAVFLLDPVLKHQDYIVSAGADTQVLLGGFLDLVNAFACIGTAVALFPVIKRQNEGVALGFVTARVMEAAI